MTRSPQTLVTSEALDATELDRASGAPVPVAGESEPATMSVAAFLDLVGQTLRIGLPSVVWLEASVVNVRSGRYGHTIELSDPAPGQAMLRAFLPTATLLAVRRRLGLAFEPDHLTGMTTLVLVAPTFHPRWHVGARIIGLVGAATESLRRLVLEQTVATLQRDGLWGLQTRLSMPGDLTLVTVVHPADAAGWADVSCRLARWQAAGLLVVRSLPAPFEGERAAVGLVRAIGDAASVGRDGRQPDVVLLVRGGGARESLAALDDAAFARAVCRCPVPIIVGTGHAIDQTLADACAWRRVETPTAAAVLVTRMIAAAAQTAAKDHAAIIAASTTAVASADWRLEATRSRLQAGLDHAFGAAQAALAEKWSTARLATAARRERLVRLEDNLSALFRAVVAHAPTSIAVSERRAEAVARVAFHGAKRKAERCDDTFVALSDIEARARALIERAAASAARKQDIAMRNARSACLDCETRLSGMALVLEAHDPRMTLRRGYVLVTDGDSRVLTSRESAADEASLHLVFRDGVLVASPKRTTKD